MPRAFRWVRTGARATNPPGTTRVVPPHNMEAALGTAEFVIDPPENVTFQIDSAGPKKAVLTLTNTSDNTLAFKVGARRMCGL